jgi:hypothetical protein
MATISFSTELVKEIMTSLTDLTYPPEKFGGSPTVHESTPIGNNTVTFSNSESGGSLFSNVTTSGSYNSGLGGYPFSNATGLVTFRNASGTTLTSYGCSELTRTIDSSGYCVLSNFPPKIPVAAGEIADIVFTHQSGQTYRTITLTVGPSGGSSDVQFDDRSLVTSQPWRLDGSIKFRVPISYTYST